MLIINCPYCGPRPELEFAHGGQAHVVRPADPSKASDEQWTEFLYLRKNTRGIFAERWRHVRGCGRFFNAIRDTTTDHFLATYRSGEQAPAIESRGAGPRGAA